METLQPKLRFPQFKGNWKRQQLGDVGDIKMCRRIFNEETTTTGDIPFFKIGSFGKVADAFISKELYINYRSRFSFPKKGDILISAAGTIGRTVIYNGEDAYFQDSNIVWIDNDNTITSNEFLFYVYQIVSFNTEGGTIQRLYNNILKSTKFFNPSLDEQTKIANFLSSIDEKLNLLKEKKTLLEDYKKGIMQKIFDQEIRFKDDNGNNFEDWEEKTIAEICIKIQSGGTPKSTNKDYYDGNIPFLSIADMTKQGKYIEYTSNSISEDGLKNSSSWIVPVNSIIYSMYASVGFVAINKIPLATSQAVLNLLLEQDICIDYIYYFLLDFQKYLAEFITTGTQGNLNAQTVKGFLIPIPSIEEQIKIAYFLSAIDEKIALVSNQIKDTHEYKKGLLQQMFV